MTSLAPSSTAAWHKVTYCRCDKKSFPDCPGHSQTGLQHLKCTVRPSTATAEGVAHAKTVLRLLLPSADEVEISRVTAQSTKWRACTFHWSSAQENRDTQGLPDMPPHAEGEQIQRAKSTLASRTLAAPKRSQPGTAEFAFHQDEAELCRGMRVGVRERGSSHSLRPGTVRCIRRVLTDATNAQEIVDVAFDNAAAEKIHSIARDQAHFVPLGAGEMAAPQGRRLSFSGAGADLRPRSNPPAATSVPLPAMQPPAARSASSSSRPAAPAVSTRGTPSPASANANCEQPAWTEQNATKLTDLEKQIMQLAESDAALRKQARPGTLSLSLSLTYSLSLAPSHHHHHAVHTSPHTMCLSYRMYSTIGTWPGVTRTSPRRRALKHTQY